MTQRYLTRSEMAKQHRLRALQARLLVAARPEDIARVSRLLGGDDISAAYKLLDHDCDVDACCAWLEDAIRRLSSQLVEDAKKRTPVDTGALRRSVRTR